MLADSVPSRGPHPGLKMAAFVVCPHRVKREIIFHLLAFFIDLFLEREGGLICCPTYLCIRWLILVCVLTKDRTHNLGPSGDALTN